MSIKASSFASIVTNPMNTYFFEVTIPEIDYTTIVESTTFPAQGQVRNIDLWYQGEKVSYPGLPENGGTWSFRIPESSDAKVKKEFDRLAAKFYNQRSGIQTPGLWKTIQIFCKDVDGKIVFSCNLKGCWLKKRSDIQLDASKPDSPLKWEYQFYYNWFEDGDINEIETINPLG